MNDLISRQALLDTFGLSEKTRKYGGDHSGYSRLMLYEIQEVIEELPSEERPHGEWKESFGMFGPIYECPHCHKVYVSRDNFCSNCGLDCRPSWMREMEGADA